jgi:phosphoribosylglycinamide formyltransferase 1
MRRLGIILSAGGSAVERALACVPDFRVTAQTKVELSERMATRLRAEGAEACLMLFSRLVTSELYDAIPTFNIHPSLLPSFPGLNAVQQAYQASVKILGATLHGVDASVDGGPIVAQIATPVSSASSIAQWNRVSFLQKSFMVLVWSAIQNGLMIPSRVAASHSIPDAWLQKFIQLQGADGIQVPSFAISL